MIQLDELKQYFNSLDNFPEFRNGCELIHDGKRFVSSHIDVLDCNTGNKCFLPYYERLVRYYEFCKNLDI